MRRSTKAAAAVPAGVPRARSLAASSSDTWALWVASSGTMVSLATPLRNTTWAASGSAQTLNSADAVTFPMSCAPPIKTISGMFSTIRGARFSAMATLESGPTGTRMISRPSARE